MRSDIKRKGLAMKFSIDIDCTPEEARQFLGLPDVKPMQDAMVKEIQERMTSYIGMTDPEAMMKTWLPAGLKGLENLQKTIWSGFTNRKQEPNL